jgi:hypothetical protein
MGIRPKAKFARSADQVALAQTHTQPMAWWAWVLVVSLGPSALFASVLLPLFTVELVRGRHATAHRRAAGAAVMKERAENKRERTRREQPTADD